MPRELVRRTSPRLDWPMWWPELRLPSRWFDLFGEEGMIRVEEIREDDALVIRAELPGVDPEKDVDLTVADGVLTLRAERREEKHEEGRHRSEFRYGSFSRTITLPPGATEDDVKATYTDGVLEVRIPVETTRAEAKKVPITKT